MMDITNYHRLVTSQKGGVCYSVRGMCVYGMNKKGATRKEEENNVDLISVLMRQIFAQTIFELQIAFNGIKFHISASYRMDECESIIALQ